MLEFSDELKAKIKRTKSLEDMTELLRPLGVDEVLAGQIWNELQNKREADGKELSIDELKTVAGGLDWLKDGCAAAET